jgi:ribosomal protein S18 acetylase RimI-like enzyme
MGERGWLIIPHWPNHGKTSDDGAMEFTVRPATAADATDVVRINVRTWQSAYVGMVPDDVLAGLDEVMDERAERTRERWSSSAPRSFSTAVAEDGHGVVGFVTYGPYRVGQSPEKLDPDVGEVLAIYVDPARQGEGAGRALLDAAVEAFRSDGVAEVRLWVLTENAPSRRFYERYGFRFDGQAHTYPMQRRDGSQVDLPEVRYTLAVDDRT